MEDVKRKTENGKRVESVGCGRSPFPVSRFPIPESGFTLLELLVVMTIIGILAAIAVPALRDSPQRAREATLKEDLFTLRSVIDQYHGDKGNYPADLQTLVTDGYIRKIPLDPMTKSADTWIVAFEEAASDSAATDSTGVTAPATPGVIDVHSGSPGKALDGTLYKEW
ncbi:MAG: prepilin-type N-terminal cleavage/methylation domain-containing protein [Acidobacteriota bacterium]|nr:prepilin-type N-terminal cleavage/methylation domain-containing protein [Acidobacteriota bacterium]